MSAAIGALALGTAIAGRPIVEKKTQADNANYENVIVTGSHIPQKARKRNIVTTTQHGTVLTIDQKEMMRNGNGQIGSQLSRYPGVFVSGGR